MILTSGGTTIPDSSGGRLASLIGGDGGFIYSNTDVCTLAVGRASSACGAYGSWAAATTGANSFGFASSAGGHIASRTFMAPEQDLSQPWLARQQLNGNTVDNTLLPNTNLYMGGTTNGLFMSTDQSQNGGVLGSGSINMQGGCLSGTAKCMGAPAVAGGQLTDLAQATITQATVGNAGLANTALTLAAAAGTDALDISSGDVDIASFLFNINSSDLSVFSANITFTVGGGTGNMLINGDLSTTSGFLYKGSDRRLKTDIRTLTDSLNNVMKIDPVSYVYKKTGRAGLGVIAQDIEKVYPALVKDMGNGYKGVEYTGLIAPLIGAVKELKEQNDALRHDLAVQGEALKRLEAAAVKN
jgi:hypothetical protein